MRYFKNKENKNGGILHISRTSTLCCESILLDLKDIELARIKCLKFERVLRDPVRFENRGKYIELNRGYLLNQMANSGSRDLRV